MNTTVTFLGALLLFSLASQPAYAYLDPGTGSLVLQALIGLIASVGVAVKVYWSKIKSFFVSHRPED